jgi:hypothetical protein
VTLLFALLLALVVVVLILILAGDRSLDADGWDDGGFLDMTVMV